MRYLLASLLCTAALATACGSAGSAPSSSQRPSVIRLTVSVLPGFVANAHVATYQLRCDPPSGTVPDAERACRALAASAGLLSPVTCPLFPDAGSELVRGIAGGARVNLRLSASSACARRWKQLSAALGVAAKP
jgi:hypothetical protein